MKLALVLVVMLGATAGIAEASHSCHEVSRVMGYSECRRFGSWSVPFSVFTELGAAALRIDSDGIDAAMRAAGASTSPLGATVAAWRTGVSFGAVYAGDDVQLGSITHGPTAPSQTLPFVVEGPAATSGFLLQDTLFVGLRAFAGPLVIGGETDLGFRMADITSPVLPGPMHEAIEGSFVLQLRGKVDVWATSWLTVGAIASVSVLDRHDVGLGIVVGLHLLPYDAAR